ncbi:MAG: cytochrome P450 [Halioglobus sp.]
MTQTVTPFRPPMVKGTPLIGSLRPMVKNPYEFTLKAYQEYGECFRFRVAHRKYVVMAGIDAGRFLAGEGKHYFGVEGFWGKAMEFMQSPHGVTGVDGEIHQYQRDLMKPLLSRKAFKERVFDLAEPVEEVIKNQQNGVVEVGPTTRHMISNQLGGALQGYRPKYEDVIEFIYYFSSIMNVYGLRKWPALMLKTPRFLRAEKIAKEHSRKVRAIAEQRSNEDIAKHTQYLDVLLPALKAKPEWFGDGEIEMHALLPFVASLDTVATNMGFLLMRLLQNPPLRARIQKEVDAVFSRGIPELDTLMAMEDLNGLIRETMRVQPVAFGITRTASEDFVFKNFQIYKGEDVLLFTTADHQNPEYFPEPKKFDIERYREPTNQHKQVAFSPFGKGPHACLGVGLADIMLPLNMGLMLYNWKIEPGCDLDKVKTIFNPAPILSKNFKIRIAHRHAS